MADIRLKRTRPDGTRDAVDVPWGGLPPSTWGYQRQVSVLLHQAVREFVGAMVLAVEQTADGATFVLKHPLLGELRIGPVAGVDPGVLQEAVCDLEWNRDWPR